AKAKLPLAICASFGRKGAPAAVPRSSKPTPNASSSRSTLARAIATNGINTKLATSDNTISRTFRNGAIISRTARPNPMASMLESTKPSIAIEMAACISSRSVIGVSLGFGGHMGPRAAQSLAILDRRFLFFFGAGEGLGNGFVQPRLIVNEGRTPLGRQSLDQVGHQCLHPPHDLNARGSVKPDLVKGQDHEIVPGRL